MEQYVFNEGKYNISMDTKSKKLVKMIKVLDKENVLYNSIVTHYNVYVVFDDYGSCTFVLTDNYDNIIKEYEPSRSVLFVILSDIRDIESKRK